MSEFGFRLRFHFTKGDRIKYENKSLEISLPSPEKVIILKSVGTAKIEDSENLVLIGSGFASEEEARRIGIRLKNTLLVLGATFRWGIDVGKDEKIGGFGKFIKEKAKEEGLLILDDVHGLITFSEELPVKFVSVKSPTLIVSKSAQIIIDELIRIYSLNPELSEKQTLALELYAMSHFESSSRARFVTLISAVEALSVRRKRSKSEIEYMDILIKLTKKSGLKESARDSLVNGLGNLKDESISKACRNLVKKHLGEEEASQFHKFYNVRSRILHNGKVPEGIELGSSIGLLDKIVSDLLLADTLREGKETK